MKMTPRQIIDELAKMDYREMKEFRVRLMEYLGIDLGPDDGLSSSVAAGPKQPVLTGEAKKFIDSL